MVGAAVTAPLSGFVMVSLRRTVGLPLPVSALVFTFVLGAGFLVVVAIRLWFEVSFLGAATVMAVPVFVTSGLYDMNYGDPR
jgi:hypothetical protein